MTVRVIDAEIAVTTGGKPHHTGRYRLPTTLTDHHTLELTSTALGGRVLRARTPAGIDQEVYALLTACQTLRPAMTSATDTAPGTSEPSPNTTPQQPPSRPG
ncbi:hypothetical protein [Paractinoplanes deccanensis]|uniref:hypothetical protein n=1 Tax=Paractinoplanes deccanensis TaxID=113561 RepID=UPI0019450977|nr:hypothetical protein [Actinoplanes deccanensis]